MNNDIKEIRYLKKYGIIGGKKLHLGWIEYQQMLKKHKKEVFFYNSRNHPMGYFGKWQYLFTSSRGTISLIQLFDYNRVGEHIFEIYCMDKEGETPAKKELNEVERFNNRKDAVNKIIEILRMRDEKQKS